MISYKLRNITVHQVRAKGQIFLRIHDRQIDISKSTTMSVRLEYWDAKQHRLKRRSLMPADEREFLEYHLKALKKYVTKSYEKDSKEQELTSVWLGKVINQYWKAASDTEKQTLSLDNLFDEFIEEKDISPARTKQYMVVKRILQRYELVSRTQKGWKNYRFDVATVNSDDINRIRKFIAAEHKIAEEFSDIYAAIPDKKTSPNPRGHNTVIDIMKKLRAFFNWCESKKYTPRSPFRDTSIGTEKYGTPYYLTKQEKQKIWMHKFSDPFLEKQRDVFIFQCSIGCRIGDLYRLRRSNIIDGCIQYIPAKTIKDTVGTVVVPLNSTAQAILSKYEDLPDGHILPLILQQDYNCAIKSILTEAGVTRWVSVVDPLTMKQVTKRINEIASSHMARRTFVGNLYKEVKDPSLIASMSGHKENSRAFNRYRAIDTETKKHLVSLLD